jgi:hypothetical protein
MMNLYPLQSRHNKRNKTQKDKIALARHYGRCYLNFLFWAMP